MLKRISFIEHPLFLHHLDRTMILYLLSIAHPKSVESSNVMWKGVSLEYSVGMSTRLALHTKCCQLTPQFFALPDNSSPFTMSVIVTLGNTSITSGKLFAFFLAQLLGAPLNSDFYALFTLEQYCNNLFSLADASSEVAMIT